MSSPVLKRGEIISQDIRDTISKRYRTATRAIKNVIFPFLQIFLF